jgi:hypothetical protein
MRGADNHNIPGDDGRGVQPDLAAHRIDVLIIVELQIDQALLSKTSKELSRLRVKRDELIAWSDIQDSLFAAVRPIGEPASRQLPRRNGSARSFPWSG